MNIQELLNNNELHIGRDNLVKDKNNKPKCCNTIYQPLVEKLQNGDKLTNDEEKLYGSSIMSLVDIVLNNKIMRYQDYLIREDARSQAYLEVLENVPKYFKSDKGSTAYSYAFRIAYTACVHVLKEHNMQKKIIEKLKEQMLEEMRLNNVNAKVNTSNKN